MKVTNALFLILLTVVTVYGEHSNNDHTARDKSDNDIDNDHESKRVSLESLEHGSTQIDNGIIIKVYNKYPSSRLITLETKPDSFNLQTIANEGGMCLALSIQCTVYFNYFDYTLN